ncbi:MAG: glycine cleavage system protein GcvH, partial [Pseudomonadota bacterium]|nr:glycine cleavage system protein GcvH [Pseudomonadota bacterium]
MSDLHYTKEHEWVRIEADGTAAVGITKHAQGRLGDVVFVDLPPVGKTVSAGDELAVVESVKAASEIYTPVSGTVTAVNETLVKDPSQVNSDPLGSGWMVR